MDVVGAAGIAIGVLSLVLSIAFNISQSSASKIQFDKVSSYLVDMHAQILTRFDRLDRVSDEIVRRLSEGTRA
jgi:hypothetical protein